MDKQQTKVGRLALRAEGSNWNAYYALADTMDEAIHLGSIRLAAVTNNPARKQAFMELMRGIVAELIEDATGHRPTWGGPETAPEHERSGSA